MNSIVTFNPNENLRLVEHHECIEMHEAIEEASKYAESRRNRLKTYETGGELRAFYRNETHNMVNDWKHFIHCMDIITIKGEYDGV